MEPNESGLSSYYPQPQPQPPPPQPQPQPQQQPQQHQQNPSSTNGILPNTAPHMVYPHSVPQAVTSPLESVRRKRGRPRKYATPEQAAAAKKLAGPSSMSTTKKKDHSFAGVSSSTSSYKKPHLASYLGNAGQGFTPHIITVAAGEDVGQKIMLFMQQSKCEICILSASGSISNASLRQPATSGGNITYEGRLDILSLCGSYVRTELGGRTGGLSVCLSSPDGQIIGGGVGGPLTAAGPVQVIVGTFLIDNKKDVAAGVKGDASASMFPSPVPSANFLSAIDSSGRIVVGGSEDQQNIGGSQFMIQHRGMERSTDWRSGTDTRNNVGYDFAGRIHEADQSPENGEYEPISDRD